MIEGGIKIVTDALFLAGATPLASCEGHPAGRFSVWLSRILPGLYLNEVRPYVLFTCDFKSAQALSQELGRDCYYHWRLAAYFHERDNGLVWMVEPCDKRLSEGVVLLRKLKKDMLIMANNITRSFSMAKLDSHSSKVRSTIAR